MLLLRFPHQFDRKKIVSKISEHFFASNCVRKANIVNYRLNYWRWERTTFSKFLSDFFFRTAIIKKKNLSSKNKKIVPKIRPKNLSQKFAPKIRPENSSQKDLSRKFVTKICRKLSSQTFVPKIYP